MSIWLSRLNSTISYVLSPSWGGTDCLHITSYKILCHRWLDSFTISHPCISFGFRLCDKWWTCPGYYCCWCCDGHWLTPILSSSVYHYLPSILGYVSALAYNSFFWHLIAQDSGKISNFSAMIFPLCSDATGVTIPHSIMTITNMHILIRIYNLHPSPFLYLFLS